MKFIYKGQEAIDAGTAISIINSLEKHPNRWRNEFIWLVRNDGLRVTVFVPYENTVITPRWIEKDVFGEERLVVPPILAAYALKMAVKQWFKKHGQKDAPGQLTKAQLDSGAYQRIAA